MERAIYKLWSSVKPFVQKNDSELQECIKDNPNQDGIDRFVNVMDPEVHFFPASGRGPHPAVMICPGGAYTHLAWSHEGLDVANLMNLNGFSAFVLKYRCPDRRQAAHADAARAMRFIRGNAEHFGIVADRFGAIGFSAGAHLVATISAPVDPIAYPATDAIDALSFRPDFIALIYPGHLTNDSLQIAPEFKITSSVPPTFLVQAEDDFAKVENSLGWYFALKQAGVPAEMHLYAEGGHGYGLLRTGHPISNWGNLAGDWFRRQAGLC